MAAMTASSPLQAVVGLLDFVQVDASSVTLYYTSYHYLFPLVAAPFQPDEHSGSLDSLVTDEHPELTIVARFSTLKSIEKMFGLRAWPTPVCRE